MKTSYKGFIAWLVLFCVGVLAIIFMDIKNIDLVGLVLGNYMFITLAILTGMIYKMRQSIGIQECLIKKQLRQQVYQEKSMLINILYVFL